MKSATIFQLFHSRRKHTRPHYPGGQNVVANSTATAQADISYVVPQNTGTNAGYFLRLYFFEGKISIASKCGLDINKKGIFLTFL